MGRALAAAAAVLALAVPASAAAQRNLAVNGSRIVDVLGRAVILHGANAVFKRPPYYPPLTEADFGDTGKLTPLVLFIAAGMFYVDWSRLSADTGVSLASLSASGLLLVFAFGGYEGVPVVAGETRDPRRDVPFALIATIVIVTS